MSISSKGVQGETAIGGASGIVASGVITVQVFSDSADEGQIYEGEAIATGGQWSLGFVLSGPYVTAIAFDGDGNTSEFSIPRALGTGLTPRAYLPFVQK